MDIGKLRNEINAVDDEIAALYVKRMALGKEIALYKREHNVPLENPEREKEILNRVTAVMPDDIKLYGKQVFNLLFDTSKAYQAKIAEIKSGVRDDIELAMRGGTKQFPVEASVACQGVAGAYSGIAAEKIFELSAISYFKDWDSVFSAVEKGFCRYGVLPIENSSVGSVNAVYDLMRKHNFYVVRSIKLRVQHYLLAKHGVKIADIKEIVSHEQAITQCSEFLKSLGDIKITRCDNTAQAAKTVSESERHDIACLSARECAGIYGLSVLKSAVQDRDGNYTRFIAISKNLEIFDGADKISITVNLPHEAGSLNKILNRFSTAGLNLTKLESRPMPNSPFEFAFYFDFEADIKKDEVKNLLAELDNSCENFLFLGAYKELG